jgi:hypothetical protein
MNYQDILSYPDTAGFALSFPSVEISILGIKKVVATKSFEYTDGLSIGKGWGTSSRRLIRTRGQSDPTGNWEVYRSSWDMIAATLAVVGVSGFSELVVPITFSYAEPSNPILTVTDQLLGVRIHSPSAKGQEGTDPLTISMQLDITSIVWGNPGIGQLGPLGAVI